MNLNPKYCSFSEHDWEVNTPSLQWERYSIPLLKFKHHYALWKYSTSKGSALKTLCKVWGLLEKFIKKHSVRREIFHLDVLMLMFVDSYSCCINVQSEFYCSLLGRAHFNLLMDWRVVYFKAMHHVIFWYVVSGCAALNSQQQDLVYLA